MPTQPQLLCWLICDAVHLDPATGKHTILGVFSNIRGREFPMVHPRMVWFLTLTDVTVGKHTLGLFMGPPAQEPRKLVEREFESKSPLHRINLINEIQNLGFKEPGQYAITVEIDGDPLLVTSLHVSS